MGHSMEGPNRVRCIEPSHIGSNAPCTWMAMMDINESIMVRELDGDDLREIGLALSERWVRAHGKGFTRRAARIQFILEDLGLDDLDHLRIDHEQNGS